MMVMMILLFILASRKFVVVGGAVHDGIVVYPGIQENLFPYQLIWDSCLAAKSLLCCLYLMIIISRCMLSRINCEITRYDFLSFAIPLCNCCSGQCKVTAGGGGRTSTKNNKTNMILT